jgi:hypothetical protein
MPRVSGSFDVKLTPQQSGDKNADAVVGIMSIAKQFHGELEAASHGHMLAIGTEVKGSAGYVAMERVTGSLQGRAGSFALQHSGTMNRGAPTLLVSVVPDSGTGALVGISGRLAIRIEEGGKHFYDFDFELPPAG